MPRQGEPPPHALKQHNAQFAQPIRSLGLRSDLATAEARRSIQSRGSPVEQLRRVTRTREAQQSGGFSQKLAQTVAGLGAGSRG